MSEEKPTFKITDRRLFNADGSSRQLERDETPAEPEANDVPPAPRPAAAAPAPVSELVSPAGEPVSAARPEPEASIVADPAAAPAPGGDPTPFANLVMFIASPAAAALGMTEHPGLAPGEVDLPLAKHCIDLLATLEQKTRGQLSLQELQILEGLLAELRMQYVSLAGSPRPAPRGFSGSDITGGR